MSLFEISDPFHTVPFSRRDMIQQISSKSPARSTMVNTPSALSVCRGPSPKSGARRLLAVFPTLDQYVGPEIFVFFKNPAPLRTLRRIGRPVVQRPGRVIGARPSRAAISTKRIHHVSEKRTNGFQRKILVDPLKFVRV